MSRRRKRFRPVKTEHYSWDVDLGLTRKTTQPNGSSSVTITPGFVTFSRNFTRVAAEVPRWKQRMPYEPVLTGELHASLHSVQCLPYAPPLFRWAYTTKATGVRTDFSGQYGVNPSSAGGLDTTLVTTATNAAIANFLSRYHYATRAVQGLVVLGEIRETMRMLHRPVEAIGSGLLRYAHKAGPIIRTYLRTPTKKILKEATKNLSNEYLQFVFGIAPALGDIGTAAEYYGRWNDRKTGFVTIKGRGQAKSANPPLLLNAQANGISWNIIRYQNLVKQQVDVKLRSAIMVECGPGPDPQVLLSSTNRLLGTGIRDFAPALWEIAPWSFFLDYILNVQEIIDAFSFATAFPHGIQQTTIRNSSNELFGFRFDANPPSSVVYHGGDFEPEANVADRLKQIDRVKLLALPIPTLQVNLGLSLKRWGNLLALARGNLPKYKPRRRPHPFGQPPAYDPNDDGEPIDWLPRRRP